MGKVNYFKMENKYKIVEEKTASSVDITVFLTYERVLTIEEFSDLRDLLDDFIYNLKQ